MCNLSFHSSLVVGMSGNSEVTSERTLSICMGLDDDMSSPRTVYSFDDSSVSDRSSSS